MPTMRRMRRAALVLAMLPLSSPAMAQTELARPAGGDVVLEWNAITLRTVAGQNGVEQVRIAAIVHLAVFEAVNSIVGDFNPYLAPVVAPHGASAEAAAATAAHAVLTAYVEDQADLLDDALEQ